MCALGGFLQPQTHAGCARSICLRTHVALASGAVSGARYDAVRARAEQGAYLGCFDGRALQNLTVAASFSASSVSKCLSKCLSYCR